MLRHVLACPMQIVRDLILVVLMDHVLYVLQVARTIQIVRDLIFAVLVDHAFNVVVVGVNTIQIVRELVITVLVVTARDPVELVIVVLMDHAMSVMKTWVLVVMSIMTWCYVMISLLLSATSIIRYMVGQNGTVQVLIASLQTGPRTQRCALARRVLVVYLMIGHMIHPHTRGNVGSQR